MLVLYVCPKCLNYERFEVEYHRRVWVRWRYSNGYYQEEFVDSEIDADETIILCEFCGTKAKEVRVEESLVKGLERGEESAKRELARKLAKVKRG